MEALLSLWMAVPEVLRIMIVNGLLIVAIVMPLMLAVAHAGNALGAFSTSTIHIRQFAATDSLS